ncbi:RNase A-like domain-containing protein [Streptacidiphilus sp. EB129]|uniref:RNase A-like domain-containing protein n=1 Tax=Streptacidiphilus sp. EB129 TaxID=3156262 RepID=UPI003510FFFA
MPKPSNPPATPTPGQPPATPAPAPGGGSGGPPAPTAEWTPPTNSGVVEVDPEQLWDAAKQMTSLRDDFIKTCHGYAQALTGTANMSGEDYVGIYFAGLYDPVAQDAMSAIGDLMNSVGGVIEGLVLSANTYAAADYASTHGATGGAPSIPVPSYGPETFARPAPATLYGYQDLESWTSNPVETALLQPLDDPIAALTAWFPKGHQDRLIAAAAAWRGIDAEVVALAQGLNTILDGLTVDSSVAKTARGGRWGGLLTSNQVQAWQQGMRKFCNKIWGAKPWGTKGLPAHPLGLAGTCAEQLATMCDDQRQAIDAARSALERQVAGTVLATVVGALLTEVTFGISDLIAEMIDENEIRAAIMTLVDTYYRPLQQIELTWNLLTLRSSLEQALQAAPTIQYMEAQADSVGTRSLHDFGYPGMKGQPPTGGKYSTKQYSGWGDPSSMPAYPVDLAGQEGTGGAHVLDRHVGLTDAQLLDRANGMDMTNPQNGSSGFTDVSSAQTLVQGDINDPANQAAIAAWLAGPRSSNPKQDQLTINETLPPGSAATGRVVVDQNGTHQVVDGNGVRAVLKYNKDLNPPFYVYTAFPTS